MYNMMHHSVKMQNITEKETTHGFRCIKLQTTASVEESKQLTQLLGKPSGGVDPSYKQRFPRPHRDKCMVVRCSAIS
jgi:hypothetical protein